MIIKSLLFSDDRQEKCHLVPASLTTRVKRAEFLGPRASAAATGKGPSRAANRKDRSEERTEVEEKGDLFK